ncbi:hypothetical protein C8Q80DRAFT_476176 [Daedaleopsis nitida]|nr:hypothetical protein C8Q80DRAFT_476176 [Daedaleopsis nitida]
MSPCELCNTMSHVEYIPTQSDSYNAGDIVCLDESIHIPVDEFYRRLSGSNFGLPTQSRRGSNISVASSDWNGGKRRPAMVLERRPIDDQSDGGQFQETVALLLATYEGGYHLREHLPLVLQHLCVAVYPHSEIAKDPDAFHLHTSPEWSHSRKDSNGLHAWLIMQRFASRGPTDGRWRNANRSHPHSSFQADKVTFARVIELLEEKWEEWVG